MDVDRLKKQADAGNLASQTILGAYYVEGLGVEVDYLRAFHLLSLPAERGVPRACYYLARLHLEGLGVPANVPEAVRLFEFAAERGEFFAQMELARVHARGKLGSVNRDFARKWYAAAAAQEQSLSDCDDEISEAKSYLASGQ